MTEFSKDLWHVKADQTSTESAILNLIINARDAMAAKGTLTVETSNLTIQNGDIDVETSDLMPGR